MLVEMTAMMKKVREREKFRFRKVEIRNKETGKAMKKC